MKVLDGSPRALDGLPIWSDKARVPKVTTPTHETFSEVATKHAKGFSVFVFRPD
jgi:hypothetical protein